MGYHMNGNLITRIGLAEAAIAAPSNCLLMRESGAGYVYREPYLRPYPGGCDDPYSGNQVWRSQGKSGPHVDGYNFLLADTHAKWMTSEASIQLANFPEDTGKSTRTEHPRANPPCYD